MLKCLQYRREARRFKQALVRSLLSATDWEISEDGVYRGGLTVDVLGRVSVIEDGLYEAVVPLPLLHRRCLRKAVATRLIKMAGAKLS